MDHEVTSAREYLRVSYDRSGRERSNSEQHDDNRQVWLGWEWGESYSDAGSASRYAKKKRDDWPRLIADLRADRFGADALVLWESSRGSRKVGEWVELLDLLEERGTKVAVTEHRRIYDPCNPRDRRSLLEDAVDSEYESAKTSGRVRRSSAAAAAAGRPHGRVPFGYRRVYDPDSGRLVGQVPVEEEAKWVRELFERIQAGHSLRSIAKDFQARGLRRRDGSVFSSQHLMALARTRLYCGERVHAPGATVQQRFHGEGATYVPAEWEPLVSKRTAMAVRRMLLDPARKQTRPGKAKHLLSIQPHVVCGVCGSQITAFFNPSPDGTRSYRCREKGCASLKADGMDEVVEAAIVGYLSRPDNVERLLAEEGDDDAIEAARLEVATIRAELDDLADQVGRGELSAALASRAEPQIRERLHRAEANAAELATPSALRGLIEPGDDVAQRWEAAPMSARRRIVKMLITPDILGEVHLMPIKGHGTKPAQRVVFHRTDDN